ncbi:hypothetical protein RQP46_007153 [Phenoliferia psychrophenolica]
MNSRNRRLEPPPLSALPPNHPRNSILQHSPSRPPPLEWANPGIELDTRDLPPLPEIKDPALRRQIFLHKAEAHLSPSESHVDVELRSNKRAETLGDSIIYHRAAEAIFRAHPEATSGMITDIRRRMIQNKTMAYLGWAYGLGERLINGEAIHGRNTPLNRDQNVLSDLFEAYVGGLRMDSGYQDGLGPQYDAWIGAVFSSQVFTSISREVNRLKDRAVTVKAAKLAGKRPPPAEFDARYERDLKVARLSAGECSGGEDGVVHGRPGAVGALSWRDTNRSLEGWHCALFRNGKFLACGLAKKQQDARLEAFAAALAAADL